MILTFQRNRHIQLSLEAEFKVVSKKTNFQNIEIWQTKHYGRMVLSNGWLQSIEYDEFIYHESIVHPAMSMSKNICQNILIIGGAEGSLLREVLKYNTVQKVTMVDIDECFVNLANEYLYCMHKGSFQDPRVHLIFEDGRKYLDQCDENYDAIFIDLNAPEINSPSLLLFTIEWYKYVVVKHLVPGGVCSSFAMSANLMESYPFACITKTMQQCFNCVIPLVFDMQLDGEKFGVAIGLKNHTIEINNFDFENSIAGKIVDFPISLDNISVYRSFLLPKYLRGFPDCLEPRIIKDLNPLVL